MSADGSLVPDVRHADGRWVAGRSPNPGGIPKRVREFQEVLDEHGTPERTRGLFDRLRALAMGELVVTKHDMFGNEYQATLPPDPAFAKLYMDRVYGPVKAIDDARTEELVAKKFEALIVEARKRLEARQALTTD